MAAILALAVIQKNERIPRQIRPERSNSFLNLVDTEFIQNFRLTKALAHNLIEELEPFLEPKTARKDVISVEAKVLCALKFFASGSYQLNVGNEHFVSMSQQSASNCIRQVINAMNRHLLRKYIKFPTERREQECIKEEFFNYCGISGVLGAIDCTHVSILAPSDDGFHHEKNYVNRKGWHSLNVQIICDMHQRILDVVPRFPGCSHDSYIWKSCNLRKCFQSRNYIHGNGWLLAGDSGYPWEQWLHTPFPSPQNPQERTYNAAHSKGRCVIERVNGILKSRFRCLSRHRVLHYEPEVAGLIINACAILHNMCINSQLTIEVDIEDDDLPFNQPADS